MMINSIYTHKEIFLRELISNASDAIDKLYFRSLTDSSVSLAKSDYAIFLAVDKDKRTLTISDNGCGMTDEELERNLGTIAKSGSFDFKRDESAGDEVDIIGQFGVGFYSAFMVAKKISVLSRPYGALEAFLWESEGVDGYTLSAAEKESFGTEITLYIKDDSEEEKYSEFLEEYRLRALVKKYSDYIRYPIKTEITRRELKEGSESEYESVRSIETLNSMVPLWKRSESEVTEEEYAAFYSDKYYDYEKPARVITQSSEGTTTFRSLLFIPSHAPFNYYSRDFERGLELYSSGVMIMERCADLLPEYFGFVRGIVDSADLSLNISRELLQHDRQLRVMARAIEKKIKSELEKMMSTDREAYEKFFGAFGLQLKYGVYSDFGAHKDTLRDLLLFKSSNSGKLISLKEYREAMKEEQKAIYYAAGDNAQKLELLPQVSAVKARGFEVLLLTDDVDEFALRTLESYDGCEFKNVTAEALDISTDEEREREKAENERLGELLAFMKEQLNSVSAVKLSASLSDYPVSLSTEGDISTQMAKILGKMPGSEGVPTASVALEINVNHPIAKKLEELYAADRDTLAKYAKILYANACLISGVAVDDPAELTRLTCELML